MTDRRVFEVGSVVTLDGARLAVGVEYDAVTVGHHGGHPPFRLNRQQAETFAQLFVHACWLAGPAGRGGVMTGDPKISAKWIGGRHIRIKVTRGALTTEATLTEAEANVLAMRLADVLHSSLGPQQDTP